MDLILLCWLSVQVLILHTVGCNNFGTFTQKWGFQNLQLSIDNQKQFRRGLSTCLFHNYHRMPTMERAFRGTNQHQWELCQKFYFSIYGISKCPFIDFLCLCLPFYLTGSSVHCYCDVLAKLSTGGHYQLLKTKAGSINFDKKVLPSANNADVARTSPFLASKWRRLLNWNSYLMDTLSFSRLY